jgi:hypothetical protein
VGNGPTAILSSLNGALDSALPPLKLLLKIKTTRDLRKYNAIIK